VIFGGASGCVESVSEKGESQLTWLCQQIFGRPQIYPSDPIIFFVKKYLLLGVY